MIHLIVAIDRHGAIGRGGDLLFHFRDDLRRFKALTMGKTLIMGRKTFESLPGGALPGRRNIVVTSNPAYTAPGIETASTPLKALEMAAAGPGDTFIIGGAKIYAELLPYAECLDITAVKAAGEDADTFFPPLRLDDYRVTAVDRREAFDFVTLIKK